MSRLLARRLAASLLVVAGLTVMTFFLARVVPSDPAVLYIGPEARPEEADRVRAQLGLDDPLPVQYLRYMGDMVTGDWGISLGTKQPVLAELLDRLPATLELVLVAMAVAAAAGVAVGVLSARFPGRGVDSAVRIFSIGGVSMPAFWLGLLLQVVVVGQLGLLPTTGRVDTALSFTDPITRITGLNLVDSLLTGNWVAFQDTVRHLVLPAITLAAYPAGLLARMTRATMLETLSQDYILVARAYGLGERLVLWRLALRNAIPPTLAVLGLALAYSLTGTFFVEVVFNWPGIGQYATRALLNLDYPAIMGVTLLGGLGYLLVNLVVDLVQGRLDPRVRLS